MKFSIYATALTAFVFAYLPVCRLSPVHAGDVVFDGKALAEFGTRKYRMIWIDRSSGSPVEHEGGTMTFSASVARDAVVLKAESRIHLPDSKRFVEYSAACECSADGKLSLRRIDAKMVRSDKVVLHEAQTVVRKDKLMHTYSSPGVQSKGPADWVEGTLPDVAVFFLVPQLVLKKDESVTLKRVMPLPTDKTQKAARRTITCLGVDSDLSTDKLKLTKFVNRPEGEKTGITYWVDGKGTLRRVLLNPESRFDLITSSP